MVKWKSTEKVLVLRLFPKPQTRPTHSLRFRNQKRISSGFWAWTPILNLTAPLCKLLATVNYRISSNSWHYSLFDWRLWLLVNSEYHPWLWVCVGSVPCSTDVRLIHWHITTYFEYIACLHQTHPSCATTYLNDQCSTVLMCNPLPSYMVTPHNNWG